MIIEYADDPETTTPGVFLNSTGWQDWGGKAAMDLSGKELAELLDFCRYEGTRRGWNDAVANRCRSESAPFHPDLLNGVPYAEWNEAYTAGAEEQRLSKHPV